MFTGREFGERKIRTYFLHKSLLHKHLRAEGVEPTHPFGYKDLNLVSTSGMSLNTAKNRVCVPRTYQKVPYLGGDFHRIFTGTRFCIHKPFNNIPWGTFQQDLGTRDRDIGSLPGQGWLNPISLISSHPNRKSFPKAHVDSSPGFPRSC